MFPVEILDLLQAIVELLKLIGPGQSRNFGLTLAIFVFVELNQTLSACQEFI